MDVVRFEFPMSKGIKPRISTSNVRQVATINLTWPKNGDAAVDEDEHSMGTMTYVVIITAAVLVVTGIVYLIQSTSKQKTDQIIEQ